MPIVEWSRCRINDALKKPVGPFKLVPEERVILTEFKLFEVETIHYASAKEIQRGKHPAATRLFLIRHRPVVKPGAEGPVCGGHHISIERGIIGPHLGHRIARKSVGRFMLKVMSQAANEFIGQRSSHCCHGVHTNDGRDITMHRDCPSAQKEAWGRRIGPTHPGMPVHDGPEID